MLTVSNITTNTLNSNGSLRGKNGDGPLEFEFDSASAVNSLNSLNISGNIILLEE